MKLNNKGITLTEIIISIALISIVLIFLFSLLITVNDMNEESKVNSTYLITKSLILKNIETDLRKATSVKVDENCSIDEFYTNYGINASDGSFKYYSYETNPTVEVEDLKAQKCIKFTYDGDSNDVAYLGIYYYKNKDSYVISYIHDKTNIKATRLLHNFESNPNNIKRDLNKINTWEISSNFNNSTKEFKTIKIPIIGSDGKDYSVLISYYG